MNNYPYTSTNNGTHTPQQYSPTATTSGATPSGTRPSPRPSACSTRLTWCATTTGIPRASRWSSRASGARASGRCRGACVRTCVSRWGLEWGIIVDRAHDPPGENNTPTHQHTTTNTTGGRTRSSPWSISPGTRRGPSSSSSRSASSSPATPSTTRGPTGG